MLEIFDRIRIGGEKPHCFDITGALDLFESWQERGFLPDSFQLPYEYTVWGYQAKCDHPDHPDHSFEIGFLSHHFIDDISNWQLKGITDPVACLQGRFFSFSSGELIVDDDIFRMYYRPSFLPEGLELVNVKGNHLFTMFESIEPVKIADLSDERYQAIGQQFFPVFVTLCLLNGCKNINAGRVSPSFSRPQRRWRERKGLPTEYSVLTIKLPGGRQVLCDREHFGHRELRHHLVRGHFATYDVNKLFGKYHGRFFVPPHARGNPDIGRKEKDYEIGEAKRK